MNNKETRSKRGNILFTPSLYEDMNVLARARGTSFNDLLNVICQEYADNNRNLVESEREYQNEIKQIIEDANTKRDLEDWTYETIEVYDESPMGFNSYWRCKVCNTRYSKKPEKCTRCDYEKLLERAKEVFK